jgi:hypothetical protein
MYGAGVKVLILDKIVSIGPSALGYTNNLKYVYFGANARTINNDALSGDSDITIDCAFSEDAPVADGAPWGAVNATINYDVPAPNPPAGLSMVPDPGLIQNIDIEPLEEIQPVEPEPVEPEPVEVKKTTRKAAK